MQAVQAAKSDRSAAERQRASTQTELQELVRSQEEAAQEQAVDNSDEIARLEEEVRTAEQQVTHSLSYQNSHLEHLSKCWSCWRLISCARLAILPH